MRGYANQATFEVAPVAGETRTLAGVACTYDAAKHEYDGRGALRVIAVYRHGGWGVVVGGFDPVTGVARVGTGSHVDLDTATAYALEDLTRHAVQAFARELAS